MATVDIEIKVKLELSKAEWDLVHTALDNADPECVEYSDRVKMEKLAESINIKLIEAGGR